MPFFRKPAKVGYPAAYASNEDIAKVDDPKQKKAMYLFNCAQRAHYNFIENYNTVLPALLISGLKHPVSAAAIGSAWLVCRVIYAVGYTRADKEGGKGRLAGSGHYLCALALYGMTGWMGAKMVM